MTFVARGDSLHPGHYDGNLQWRGGLARARPALTAAGANSHAHHYREPTCALILISPFDKPKPCKYQPRRANGCRLIKFDKPLEPKNSKTVPKTGGAARLAPYFTPAIRLTASLPMLKYGPSFNLKGFSSSLNRSATSFAAARLDNPDPVRTLKAFLIFRISSVFCNWAFRLLALDRFALSSAGVVLPRLLFRGE